MNELKVKRTTYKVDGVDEPCIIVDAGYAQVRIAKCHHLIGDDTLYLTEFLDGDFNAREEWKGDYDTISTYKAKRLAMQFSPYIR